MSKKVMKLIDPSTGFMECKVCGFRLGISKRMENRDSIIMALGNVSINVNHLKKDKFFDPLETFRIFK